MIDKIISGGQTGADRAALDMAIKLEIPHAGWCPRGRLAEDGKLHECYNLKCPSDNDSEEKDENIYNERTRLNIRDSDGTLILVPKIPLPVSITDGTNLTIQEVKASNKPYLIIDVSEVKAPDTFIAWVEKNHIKTLNIAGPRESQSPGIYKMSSSYLEKALSFFLSKEAKLRVYGSNLTEFYFFSKKCDALNNKLDDNSVVPTLANMLL